jgi:CBS domain-containing protein
MSAEHSHYASEIATAHPGDPVAKLADRMEEYAIGCIVIVDADRQPVGIVTDRDLACRVVAHGLDPEATPASAVMKAPVVIAEADEPIESVVERMRAAGVRRIPVVEAGKLVGIVTADDLVLHLGRELEDLGQAAKHAIDERRRRGRRERRREDFEESLAALRATVETSGREAVDFITREFETLRERFRKKGG